jgi:hypothetical protein
MELGFKKVGFLGIAAYSVAWLLSLGKPAELARDPSA